MVDDVDSQETSIWSPGVFQEALRGRREAILARLDMRGDGAAMSELVFDLLVHLALNREAEDIDKLVASFARRHDLNPGEAAVDLGDGALLHISHALNPANRTPEIVAVINALFSRGFAEKIAPLEVGDRRSFTMRVVGLLPGIERLGPYVISDYIDLVCDEEDAFRFWRVYVERVAAEVTKRSQRAEESTDPWLLTPLLTLNREAPPIPRGRAWMALKQHVKRVLRIDRHRWRFIRTLVEGCDDLVMLHYICNAPAFVEDPEVLHVFLTRGDAKLVSCALFAMQVQGELDSAVGRLLEYFRSRPLPEIAERVTELYAQLHLPSRPNANLRRLILGLRTLVMAKVAEGGSVESLAKAVASDSRAFRHCMLLAELAEDENLAMSPQVQRLLERVMTLFFQSFTPSGVDHPLNDEVFRDAIRRSARTLVAVGATRIRDRLESFGLELAEHVERWAGESAPDQVKWRLLGRFAAVYAQSVVAICRTLYVRDDTREQARLLYQGLLRVYLEHFHAVEGQCSFGALEYSLAPLFPDLIQRSDERLELGDLVDASHTIATLELAFGPLEDDSGRVSPEFSSIAMSSLIVRKPERDKPLVAPVEILQRRVSAPRSVLRAYLGIDVLAEWGGRCLRLLGMRRRGEIRLTDREVVVTSARTIGDRVIERTGDSHNLEDLLAVHVRHRLRLFYWALGVCGLLVAGLVGGHLLFVGLRGAETAMALVGAGIVGGGMAFDMACTRLSEHARGKVVLELHCQSRPEQFSLLIDSKGGAELLDAFMANDAERRELHLIEEWSETQPEWQPLETATE